MNRLNINSYNLAKLFFAALLVLSVIGVSAAILSMLFGKPIGDDYGGIATFKLDSSWFHEAYKSITMTGRYGQSLASSTLYALLGNNIPVLLPLVCLAWLIIIVFAYTHHVIGRFNKGDSPRRSLSFSLALILTFLILFINNTPATNNLPVWASYQLFFWPSGIITYTIPLLLLLTGLYTVFLADYSRNLSSRKQIVSLGVVVFLTGLFNEVQPVFVLVASSMLFLASFIKYYEPLKRARPSLIVTAGMSAVALLALFFSPGRVVRSQGIDNTTTAIQGSLLESIERNIQFLIRDLYFQPREVLLIILTGTTIAFIAYALTRNKARLKKNLFQLLPFSFFIIALLFISLLISISLVAIGYGYDAGIYSRTLLIAQLMYIVGGTFLVFVLSGIAIIEASKKKAYFPELILTFTGILFMISIPNYLNKITMQVNSSVLYSNEWTAQDEMLRNASQDNISEMLYLKHPANGIGDGFSFACTGPYAGSTMWLNALVSEYYGAQDKICEAPQTEISQ